MTFSSQIIISLYCEGEVSASVLRFYSFVALSDVGMGRDSSVGIATDYGLDGPGIESRWGQDFPPWGPPSLLYNGYRVFSGGKERPGRDAYPSPPSSAVVMKV